MFNSISFNSFYATYKTIICILQYAPRKLCNIQLYGNDPLIPEIKMQVCHFLGYKFLLSIDFHCLTNGVGSEITRKNFLFITVY